ncbi:type II toxin-antitoxin system VapC family toxin [Andreprevotia chitinilytica]|uniref:type II toxin-antitoxin system VapC family toxin n=1 Tax=Andreprevotia chitinilytica TaxID=396808 RepID=UPI0005568DF5|nr:type II toxin-antitoxin system VapC family toxin [Andreprevotia chitinilytica]
MIICDTHALVFWALAPDRLTPVAAQTIEVGKANGTLGCADISLWEIAMLTEKGRIQLPIPTQAFLDDLVDALKLKVLPISPAVAALAQGGQFPHGDPADRLIGATAMTLDATLVSADSQLALVPGLRVTW